MAYMAQQTHDGGLQFFYSFSMEKLYYMYGWETICMVEKLYVWLRNSQPYILTNTQFFVYKFFCWINWNKAVPLSTPAGKGGVIDVD